MTKANKSLNVGPFDGSDSFGGSSLGLGGAGGISSALFSAAIETGAVFASTGTHAASPVPCATDLDCASQERTNPDRSLNPISLTSSSSCRASSAVSRNVTFVVDNDDARFGRAIHFEYCNESMRVKSFRPTNWAHLHASKRGYVRRNGRSLYIRQSRFELSSDEMEQWLRSAPRLRGFVRRNGPCSTSISKSPSHAGKPRNASRRTEMAKVCRTER